MTMTTHYNRTLAALYFCTVVFCLFVSTYIKPQLIRYRAVPSTFNTTYLFDLEFSYVINNNCTKYDATIAVLIVTSFFGNTEARSAHRIAYHQDELRRLGIYRVFLLANAKLGTSNATQEDILQEAATYNDIIQGNFLDDYRNLTYKHVMGIRWAVKDCAAPFIIKMDDDVVVDLYSLLEVIESVKHEHFDILGNLQMNTIPVREKSKWCVTKEEYPSDVYPVYASGALYVMTYRAASEVVHLSETEKFFWIDDMYVSGILAQKANLTYLDLVVYYTKRTQAIRKCIKNQLYCEYVVSFISDNHSLIVDFQRHSKAFHKPKRCKLKITTLGIWHCL